MRGHGVLNVANGSTAAARAAARLLRLPRAGEAVETRLIVTAMDGRERWTRTFGQCGLDTWQYPAAGGIFERIGALELRFQIDRVNGSRIYRQTGAALVMGSLRIRLPRWAAPLVCAREDPAGPRRVRIDVRVSLPAIGPILTYAGTIDHDEAAMTEEHA